MQIRVGAHPSNLTLTALTFHPPLQQPLRDAGLDPVFRWYPKGSLMQNLAESGEVNVIGTGTTRGVVAQAQGLKIAYIGASRPRRSWSAILVREDSPIRSTADLKGRRIGLIEGSFQTYFLLAALDRVGLSYDDVGHTDVAPTKSLEALRAGEIDAWVAMDPYLGAAVAGGGLRKLLGNDGVISNRSIFWVLEEVVAAGQAVVQTVHDTIAATDDWIRADPARSGKLFAESIQNGLTPEEWAKSVAGRDWGIELPDADLFAEQQAEGDLMFKHGMLPRAIDLREAVLPFPLRSRDRAAA
ncbi:ABC transporter substrate-binding protein [Roseomonas sp. BN140053]|uniref:ABC transporter substrate-binding protein n=1 Tax=Roseomonas sp. BN140053 TaxID=3391898 RepID=UPI0039ECD972